MERAIGDLGQDIRQPSNPFANLTQIAIRRAQMNALLSLCPELDPEPNLPKYSRDHGNGIVFLPPRQRQSTSLKGAEKLAVETELNINTIRKWGRVRLPNGQVARSIFAEGRRVSAGNTRITCNVKVS
jgi:hypothetical protein